MPARRSGLGRGLDAIIPSSPGGQPAHDAGPDRPVEGVLDAAAVVDPAVGTLREVPVDDIDPNRYQPRASFADEDLDDLADSIRELGVLQPLLLRSGTDGRFELIAGERRLRAARRAGLDRVPAVVRTVEDQAALEQALVENVQRSDLNPMEEAVAYRRLIDEFSLTQEAVAARVGRSRPTVANTLRLLQLDPTVQEQVRGGALSGGHARALLSIVDAGVQRQVADQAAAEAWSVRRTEDEVRQIAEAVVPPADEPPVARGEAGPDRAPKGAALLELELLLAEHLDTRVRVQMAGGGRRVARGKIIVEFAGLDDLERIYRAMSPPAGDDDAPSPPIGG